MNTQFHIVYPYDGHVTAEKIMMQASDAYADGVIEYQPDNVCDAILLLADAGLASIEVR